MLLNNLSFFDLIQKILSVGTWIIYIYIDIHEDIFKIIKTIFKTFFIYR